MNTQTRIIVGYNNDLFKDIDGINVLTEIRDLGITSVKEVSTAKTFTFPTLPEKQTEKIKERLLIEPLWVNEVTETKNNGEIKIEIELKPGVTNTEIDSIVKAVKDLGITLQWGKSGRVYTIKGNPTYEEIELIKSSLFNKTIEQVAEAKNHNEESQSSVEIKTVPIGSFTDSQLVQFSKDNLLFLSLAELIEIKKYFLKKKRDPTDCEIETLAQTWSEHNYHKTFRSTIKINGTQKESFIKRIQKTTKKINHKDALVVFSDNAGIVVFDEKHAICAKTETHNSPSAIEPYGGSMTGVGGVLRDIAGTGLGAKNIAGSDVFCFGFPDQSQKDVPKGCIHPKKMMQKCIQGVRDYGNRMGIPTVNGSLNFDPNYRAKPVVLVGAVGILPKKYVNKKNIKASDLVITVGGKTGRDGIHGATFSSGEMSENTSNTANSAVQIGNPIEQKRMLDALLEARDKNLIKYITDCGGGGYSSSIGEIAKDHGVKVDLSLVPLKYKGLKPWEIWLSEAQERMTVILDKKDWKDFQEVCERFNTKAHCIGEITDDNELTLVYKDKRVANLDMKFLHEGVPKSTLMGVARKNVIKKKNPKKSSLHDVLLKILSHPNVASKEEIVRRYDHEVQGRLALKPFSGDNFDSPNDAAIIKPLFNSQKGVSIAHGLNTKISKRNPYLGALYAVDECMRNLISVGTNPNKIFLLDNFIFPKVDENVISDLDKTVDGLCSAALVFKTPFISGKDSLSGTYQNGKTKIEVPPTTCVSAIGIVEDIQKSISSDIKKEGSILVLVGEQNDKLGGSVFEEVTGASGLPLPDLNLNHAKKTYTSLNNLIEKGYIHSAHDVSEGGMVISILEMFFGSTYGITMNISAEKNLTNMLFSEAGGRIIIEIDEKNLSLLNSGKTKVQYQVIGKVNSSGKIILESKKREILNRNINELKKVWQSTFQKYF